MRSAYQSWLDALLGDLERAPLRRFASRIEQGWSPVVDTAPAGNGDSGVLKLGAVRGGEFRPNENKSFLPGESPREEYRILDGDLLITRANTPLLVGDVAVARRVDGAPLYLSDLIYRVTLHEYDPDLASAALRTTYVRQLVGVLARGTSGSMPKLRGEDVTGLPIPVTPLSEQRAFGAADVKARADRERRIEQLTGSIDLLTEYKSSLITAAVTGELDVTTAGSRIPAV